MKKKRVLGVILIIISFLLTFLIGKYIYNIASDEVAFKQTISNSGLFGYIFFLFLTSIQVVFPLIPSEVLELAAGYAFGSIWGTILCLLGITLGSSIVILLTKKYGMKFVSLFYTKEKIDSINLNYNEKKLYPLIFILFLIPGTPKDLITYVIGFTKVKLSSYLLLATFARIPSIVISTIAGSAVRTNNINTAIIFIVISIVTGILGFLSYKVIIGKK